MAWLILAVVVAFLAAVGVLLVVTWRSAKSDGYKALVFGAVAVVVGTLLPVFARPIEMAWDTTTSAAGTPEVSRQAEATDGQRPTGTPAAGEGALTAATAARLSDDTQLSRYVQMLGPPLSQKRLQNDEWLVSSWASTDIAVGAFSNRDSQVVASTLTPLAPGYTPLVQYLRGGVRLRASVFADAADMPDGIGGIYPPNARFSYEELHQGGGAVPLINGHLPAPCSPELGLSLDRMHRCHLRAMSVGQ